MLEDDCAVVLVEVFAQLQAVAYPTDQLREGSLAELDRLASQIAAIELQDARASAKIVPTFTNEINGLS